MCNMMLLTETGHILEGSCTGGVKAVLDKVSSLGLIVC